MKFKIGLIFYSLFFSFPFCSNAGDILSQSKEVQDLVSINIEKGNEIEKLFPDSAIYFYQKGLQILEDSTKLKTHKNYLFSKTDLLTKIGYIFFLQSKYSFATNYYNKALITAKLSGNDSLQAECYFNIGELCLENGNCAKAVNYYSHANSLYEKINNKEGMFWSNIGLGIIFRELGNKDLSIYHAEKAKQIGKEEKNKLFIATSENNIGNLYTQIGDYKTALKYLMNSLKSFMQHGDEKLVSDCYESIGDVYKELKEFTRAIEYYRKSTEIAESLNDNYRLFSRYANLATSFSAIHSNENALMYFSKTVELARSIGDKDRMSKIYIMLADFYKKNKNLEKARDYINLSLINSKEVSDTVSIVAGQIALSELLFLEGKYNGAYYSAKNAFEISQKKNLTKNISEAAKNLSQISLKLKDYKSAYKFLEIYKSVEDSLFNLEKITVLEDIQAKYKLEQLENEKTKIVNEANLTENQLQNRNLLILILAISIIGSLFVFITYFLRKRNEKIEEKEKASRLTKKIDLLNNQLNLKNRELTSKALLISHNNKTLQEIIGSIDLFLKDENGDKRKIRHLKNKLQEISEKDSWNDFLQHFEEVHPKFYKKLTEKYTSLTSSELKICAFLKMNLNTKEIAQITNQTTKSVEVARTRIRKKLGVEHNESLTQAIQSL